jgi:hypothetical protein
VRVERRRHERKTIRTTVRAAAPGERPVPVCETVDASAGGVLLAFDEPTAFPLGARVLLTLMLPSGRCHLIGTVRRTARGDDFRTYAAIELENRWDEEHERLERHLTDADDA